MIFTIVIPVLNGEKYLPQCLDAIKNLRHADIEIKVIAIDNGSTDNTHDILRNHGIEVHILRNVTISSLRNYGATLAAGPYVGFLDCDCIVDPDWLVEAVSLLDANDNVGIVGRFYDVGVEPSWVESAWCSRKKSVDGIVDFIPAGNMVVRKSLFEKLGGFSNSIVTGEDYELCQRVRSSGHHVINTPRVNVRHLGNVKTLSQIIKKERWYALGMFSTLSREKVSKPLTICILFMLIISGILVSALFNSTLALLMVVSLLLLTSSVSIKFIQEVKDHRLLAFLKFVPISFCYMIGRSIGIFDICLSKLRGSNASS